MDQQAPTETSSIPPVANPTTPGASSPFVRTRLAVMMFLQYAIWGAWLPLLWPFLNTHRGFTPSQIGNMFAVGAIGAIVAPFVAGQIADRWFSTEKFLGISHILGGVLVWNLATIDTYGAFLLFSLLYSLIYSPTLSLTNSISFHNLKDRDRDFGKVRLFGTVGWIAVGIGIGQWLLHRHTPSGADAATQLAAQAAGMGDAFRLSAILGILMGVYCFTLPHTPPMRGEKKNATVEALQQIRLNPLLMLFLLAIPISCIHQFYFVHTANFLGQYQANAASTINRVFGVGGGGLMTVGQIAEILVLGAMPVLALRFSRKSLLAVGIAAYAARMALFAYVDPIASATGIAPVAILILGVAMHGLCFGCFVFIAFMVVDEETTPDVRATAQSLFSLILFGIGIIVGSKVAGYVASIATTDTGALDYTRLFSYPMWASIACFVALLAFYPRRSPKRGMIHAPAPASA
jgi:nucleoside transporter